MILTALHPDLSQQERAYTASSIAEGATTITVKSASELSNGAIILLGNLGSEKTEINYITDITGEVITLQSATKYSHGVDTVITVMQYDQVQFHKKSIGGTYGNIATVSIEVDDELTRYDYSAGLATDYFKVNYRNSVTEAVSEYSGEVLGTGYTSQSLSSIIDDIRVMIGEVPSDDELLRLINLAQSVVWGMRDNWYFAQKTQAYTTLDSTATYDLPEDFASIKELYFNDGSTITKLQRVTYDYYMTTFAADTNESDTQASYVIDEANNHIIIYPIPAAGTKVMTLHYYAKPTPLSIYTDATEIPVISAIVFWVCSKVEAQKNNIDKAKMYWNEYNASINALSNKRITKLKNFSVR